MKIGITGADSKFSGRVERALDATMTLVPCQLDDESGFAGGLDAIIIGNSFSIDDALRAAQTIEETSPTTSVVLVSQADPKLFRKAMLAGARDVWAPNISATEMVTSLQQVVEASGRRAATLPSATGPGPDTGRVIVVLSPKGGAGKTTIATNLAMGLARRSSRSVAIVDLDLQFGDVATALNLTPEFDIVDASLRMGNMTGLKTTLAQHPSGVFALCAPLDPAAADSLTPEVATRLVELIATEVDDVVIDTAAGLDEFTLAALDQATDLVIVSTTDIFAVKGTRKLLDILELIDLGEPDRHFVLNRANARVDISRAEIESLMKWRVDVEIPSTRMIPLAVNRGQSLLDAGKIARRPIEQLLGRFVDESAHRS